MQTVPIKFPSSTAPSKLVESGGRLINVYAESLQDGRIAHRTVAGLRELFNVTGFSNCRGMIQIASTLLVALEDRLFAVTEGTGGTYDVVDLGALAGSAPVYIERNNKLPIPDIVAVTDGVAYLLTTSTAPVAYPDIDVGSPNCVAFLGGFFIFSYGDGKMQASGINDTTINTLDFAFAERSPDSLHRVFVINGILHAIGSATVEYWQQDVGNANGFPFSRVSVRDKGVLSATAIAGNEIEWTNQGIFVGNDNIVYRMEGYQSAPISTPAIQRLIENCADKTKIRISVYSHSGHPCAAITSDEWTLTCDMSSNTWFERKSYGFDNWRVSTAIKAFGKWVCGTRNDGRIYTIDENYFGEGNDPLVWTMESTVSSGFPNKIAVSCLDINAMVGVGDEGGQGVHEIDPQLSISWSKDGGVSYSQAVLRKLGRQGKYDQVIKVNRLGLTSPAGFRVKLSGSAPVPTTILGASIQFEARQ